MIVVYDSLTGKSAQFAKSLGLEAIDIADYEDQDDHILLVTRSWDFGLIPESTQIFLDRHAKQVLGVCVSGNRNWGTNYGAAGDKISAKYKIKLVLKFEGAGTQKDSAFVRGWIEDEKD